MNQKEKWFDEMKRNPLTGLPTLKPESKKLKGNTYDTSTKIQDTRGKNGYL